ncbi:hypothetical protein PMAYCL1PPCAC_26932, partial [Pristionchus mayeri]
LSLSSLSLPPSGNCNINQYFVESACDDLADSGFVCSKPNPIQEDQPMSYEEGAQPEVYKFDNWTKLLPSDIFKCANDKEGYYIVNGDKHVIPQMLRCKKRKVTSPTAAPSTTTGPTTMSNTMSYQTMPQP